MTSSTPEVTVKAPSRHITAMGLAPKLVLRGCLVDLRNGHLSDGARGALTARELCLLRYLVERSGETVTREELSQRAFGYAPTARTRAVDKAMHGLRRKVERSPGRPEHLLTSIGSGYRFESLASMAMPAFLMASEGPLVGRERILQRLTALRSLRMVTLWGPHGVGKTRIAREFARSWRSRGGTVVWVELADAMTPEAVRSRVARALVQREGVPDEMLGLALAELPSPLLVVDNAKSLSSVPELVAALRRADPDIPWLCTATRALEVEGEEVVHLPPLSVEAGMELFHLRAESRGYPLGGDPAVRDLVRALDALPLALELAAARVGALGVADLLTALDREAPFMLGRLAHRLDRELPDLLPSDLAVLSALVVRGPSLTVKQLQERCEGWPPDEVVAAVERLVKSAWMHPERLEGHVRFTLLSTTRRYLAARLALEVHE